LLYTGVIRSPLAAVAPRIKLDHCPINLAQENFATMLDVYLVLERIAERDSRLHTADGRAADIPSAFRRLAKMICCDLTEVSRDILVQMAIQAAEQHAELIGSAIESVNRRHGGSDLFVVCGEGAWLAEEILNSIFLRPTIVNQHSGQLSDTPVGFSTAHAVAKLARQRAEVSA
jgi:uncharacterized hydantoinase/oxoprolinase family protein